MKILFTGDWHLDAKTFGFRRMADVQDSAMAIVALVKDEQVDVVVNLGDLCDPHRDEAPAHARFAIQWSREVIAANAKSVIWVVGNHDVIEDGRGGSTLAPIGAVGGPISLASRPMVIGSIACLPHAPKSHAYDTEDAIARMSQMEIALVDVVVGHLSISGYTPGSESGDMARGREMVFPVDAVRKCAPEVPMINGHYHAQFQDPYPVWTPGSLVRLRVDEVSNTPGVLIYDSAEKSFERIPIPDRQMIDISAEDKAWRDKATLRQNFEGALVRLRVPTAEGAKARLVEEIVARVQAQAAGVKVERPKPVVIASTKLPEGPVVHEKPVDAVARVMRRTKAPTEIVEAAIQRAQGFVVGAAG